MPSGCGTGFRAVRVFGFGAYCPLFNLRRYVNQEKGRPMKALLPPAYGGGQQLRPHLQSVGLGLADSSNGGGESGVVGIAHRQLFHSSSKCTATAVLVNRRASGKQRCGYTVLHGFEVCNFKGTGRGTQNVSNGSFSTTGYGGRTQGRRPSLSDVAGTSSVVDDVTDEDFSASDEEEEKQGKKEGKKLLKRMKKLVRKEVKKEVKKEMRKRLAEAQDGIESEVEEDDSELLVEVEEIRLEKEVVEATLTIEMTENERAEELEDDGIEEGEANYDEVEDFWEDDKPADLQAGDGEDGGGTVLGDAEWGQRALSLATETLESTFSSTFALYAFKLSKDAGVIRVRLDKLTDKYGSPSLTEIEKFSSVYGKRLEEEGLAGTIPDNLALEVSSPGAERVVKVPHDLLRFKDLPMFVRYWDVGGNGEASEKDSILQVDKVEADMAVWKLANVRANREVAGRGRPLNKKQKEWRLELPFSATKLVRLYLDV